MNTMTYKGYTARVEYDERDNIFAGRILGIRSIISFHGETVAELKAEFELAIKDYLADCKQQCIHPEKPASGKLLLRVPPEIHGRALVAAQAAGKIEPMGYRGFAACRSTRWLTEFSTVMKVIRALGVKLHADIAHA